MALGQPSRRSDDSECGLLAEQRDVSHAAGWRRKAACVSAAVVIAGLFAVALCWHSVRNGVQEPRPRGPGAATSPTPMTDGGNVTAAVTTTPMTDDGNVTEAMTTATTKTTTPMPGAGLFCWLVTTSSGYEAALVQDQFHKGRGVFACDLWSVFSDAGNVTGMPTTSIGSLKSPMASWGSYLNTEVFLRAWDAVIAEGKFAQQSWTVKVDADTVFIPYRLLLHLQGVSGADPVYVRASSEYLGPIEVFSRGAVLTFAANHTQACRWGVERSGEDGFIADCMGSKLQVPARIDDNLLWTMWDAQQPDCTNGQYVAFHPVKDVAKNSACYDVALR